MSAGLHSRNLIFDKYLVGLNHFSWIGGLVVVRTRFHRGAPRSFPGRQ